MAFGNKRLGNERDGKMQRADSAFNNMIKEIGLETEFQKRLVISRWNDIVGPYIAKHVHVVSLKWKTLYVYSTDPQWADNMKFMTEDIITKMNQMLGNHVVKNIVYLKKPMKTVFPYVNDGKEQIKSDKTCYMYDDFSEDFKTVQLSDEDIGRIKKICGNVENDELRHAMERAYITKYKLDKLKVKKGYHPCPVCKALTPADDELCPNCRRKARLDNAAEIRKILMDEPWLTYAEMAKRVPCTEDMFCKQRAYIVQNLLPTIDIEHPEDVKTKTFVMIFKSCPPEIVASDENYVEKALKELRNDFGERYYELMRKKKEEKHKEKIEARKHRYDKPKKKK